MGQELSHILKNEESDEKGNIFLTGQYGVQDTTQMVAKKVGAIVSMNGLDHPYPTKKDMHHLKISNLDDFEGEKIGPHFEATYEFIDKHLEKTNVVVHCAEGVSRSPTIVIAYLMKKLHWSYMYTIGFVKDRRKSIRPNRGFKVALMDLERELEEAEGRPTKMFD